MPNTATLFNILILLAISTMPGQSLAAESDSLYSSEPILPLQPPSGLDENKIQLGDMLFHDPRLSGDNTISCATCHPINAGGMDGQRVSTGVNGRQGELNTPTVLNSGLSFTQFWDGRAPTLEQQIDNPLLDPNEMNTSWEQVLEKLRADKDYVERFSKIYPDGITPASVRDAIATFERSLVTLDSPFDRYLRGEQDAITEQEREGYQLFKAYGCAACHQGAAVGGNLYEKLGVITPYYDEMKTTSHVNLGRYNVTGKEAHRYVFKVPSLRNVALTAPYLHNGSISTLEDMVYIMGMYQLGRKIPHQDARKIVAFLKTLTGKTPE